MTETALVGKPQITFGLSKNVFWWQDLSVRVVADRITPEGKAELSFYHENGSGPILLHICQANLLSNTVNRDLPKIMQTRGPAIDWQTVITYVAVNTMSHLREGEPVVWLDASYGKVKPSFLVPPLFVENAANIVYADKGSAKSLFITLVDICLTLGDGEKFGLRTGGRKHTVLFLDWENDPNITGWQKECLLRGMGFENLSIPYRRCAHSLADDIEQIKSFVDRIKADVVIIDSLGMAVGDDLNLTKPAFAFYAALRQLPVTPIIIGHTSKDKESRFKTVYGNAYYENEARSIWEVSKKQEQGSNELLLTLFQRKCPPFVGIHTPLAFRFTFEDDKTYVETSDPAADKREDSEATDKEKVYSAIALADTPPKPKELEATTGVSNGNIRVICHRLLKEKKIVLSPNGGYVVTE